MEHLFQSDSHFRKDIFYQTHFKSDQNGVKAQNHFFVLRAMLPVAKDKISFTYLCIITVGAGSADTLYWIKRKRQLQILRSVSGSLALKTVSCVKMSDKGFYVVGHFIFHCIDGSVIALLKCYINEILSGGFGSRRALAVTVVYSGGDDVFLVGAWNDTIAAAVRIDRIADSELNDAEIAMFNRFLDMYITQIREITKVCQENYSGGFDRGMELGTAQAEMESGGDKNDYWS